MLGQDTHFDRLTEVVKDCYDRQRPHRALHRKLVEHLKGDEYPRFDGSSGLKTSINLLSMANRAICRQTISKAPRVLVTPDIEIPQLKSWAENAELAANKRIEKSNASRELAECSRQANVSYGILFVAPAYIGTEKEMKLDLQIRAIPRADHVFDDDCLDMEESDIQGHKFRLPLIDVLENPLFDQAVRAQVKPDGDYDSEPEDEKSSQTRPSGRRLSLYDYVELWCIFERRRNKLIYYPRKDPSLKLAEIDWYGPEHGPYRYLYYEKPPNSAMPLPPLMHLLFKHRAFNMLDVKATHQQQVAKALLAYTNASKEEAETVLNAVDNQSVLQENGAVRWMHVGGASPDTIAMAEKQKSDFSYAAGNLESQMGLGQQGDTLGQERLLAGAANAMLEDMQGTAFKFVKGFAEDVFWFDLRDPSDESMTLSKSVPGTGMKYSTSWTKEHREFVRELKWNISVEPYSYVDRSPKSRSADLLGAVQIYMGLAEQAMAQGISLDVEALMRHVAKTHNLPELYDVLILNQDPEDLQRLLGPGRGSGAQPYDGGNPKRYIRESQSDGSGENIEMMRMLGRGQQSQEQVA